MAFISLCGNGAVKVPMIATYLVNCDIAHQARNRANRGPVVR